MIESGDQEAIELSVCALRHITVTQQRVGLVGQREDQIGLQAPGIPVDPDHGDTVEQVPGIHHDGGKDRRDYRGPAGQQSRAHILHGARIDRKAHGQGPKEPVAGGVHQHAEAEPKHDVARHDGDRSHKRLPDRFAFQIGPVSHGEAFPLAFGLMLAA